MGKGRARRARRLEDLLWITEELNHIKDIDSLLDKILYEARKFTNADAGSIYLRHGDNLTFSYTQNDTLAARDSTSNKFIYSIFELPIDEKSITGHVAMTGKPLLIRDCYKLGPELPYAFNRNFDELAGYRTKSVLTVPLMASGEHVVGVMQIINAKDALDRVISFSERDMVYVSFFANNASVAVERAKMTREMILRMIRMAELRDPKETGAHVNRVGAYTIEIYDKWARNHGLPEKEIRQTKDVLRISSMLHDVGKVAISDTILKKPARLDADEFRIMQTHTVQGARLFNEAVSDWDRLSASIALNHHEKWDGTGYPGHPSAEAPDELGAGKTGETIPIEGRIVALADVYDALISKRVYKESWAEGEVLDYIKAESGKQFDPDVVNAFFEIYDVIKAIRKKYAD